MKYAALIALVAGVLVTVGCATTFPASTPNIAETVEAAMAAALPTATPTPTPDIDATVEARVQAALSGTSTPAFPSTANPTITPIPPTVEPSPTLTITPAPSPTPPPSLAMTIQRIRPAVVRVESAQGSGTGVIIESVGQTAIVLTNFHVIEGANPIYVIANDSARYPANIKGVDATRDLAALEICCGTFRPIEFGDAAHLEPGTAVFSIGYPLNIQGEATVTTGIVSAVRYESAEGRWVIQSDAAINPGNSGGPMLLQSGELVGINTFKYESTIEGRPVEGLGFAVSEVTIREGLERLKSGSYLAYPTPTPRPSPTFTPNPTPVFNGIYRLAVDGIRGDAVTFRVGTVWAGQSGVWQQGGVTQLNLTANGAASNLSPIENPRIEVRFPSPLKQKAPPQLFAGTVTLNGIPAPAGTEVSAWIGGNLVGATSVVMRPGVPLYFRQVDLTFGELGDNLEVVWRFDYLNGDWRFYSPHPTFSYLSTLIDAAAGDIIWIYVDAEQDFQGQTLFPGWNLIALN